MKLYPYIPITMYKDTNLLTVTCGYTPASISTNTEAVNTSTYSIRTYTSEAASFVVLRRWKHRKVFWPEPDLRLPSLYFSFLLCITKQYIWLNEESFLSNTEPIFANLCSSPGIDSQPGGPLRQPYLLYRPARLHRLAESIPRNWFLGSLNVYKFGLWPLMDIPILGTERRAKVRLQGKVEANSSRPSKLRELSKRGWGL
jgi:hypothetical protein